MDLIRRQEDGKPVLWASKWEADADGKMHRKYLHRIAAEPTAKPAVVDDAVEVPAICWHVGRTMGNIAVYSSDVVGRLPGKEGSDAELECTFVHAGKFRHGAERWWCQVHQAYWGLKADIEDSAKNGMRCANYAQALWYVKNPKTFDAGMAGEFGVWCGMPAALSNRPIERHAPRIHVHIRHEKGGKKVVDEDYPAISITVPASKRLFQDGKITRINVTPPAAYDFVLGLEEGREMTTLECNSCKFPHLDLGEFARRPHKKHTCGNCGWDHTWSDGPAISNPLKRLHDETAGSLKTVQATGKVNLDEYEGCDFDVWPSTPAIVWTAKRPQEVGIHVHVWKEGKQIVNETFGEVVYRGKKLDRKQLWKDMLANTDVVESSSGVGGMM